MKKLIDVASAGIAANVLTSTWSNSLGGLASAKLVRAVRALGRSVSLGGKVSLSFKITGATARTGPSLCLSCSNGKVVRGQNCEELVFCSSYEVFGNTSGGPSIVPFRVAECGGYTPANTPSLDDMKRIAWDVSARKRGSVGFEGGTRNPDEMITEITPPKRRSGGEVVDE